MKPERSNVGFAIWRKKVDKSIFEHDATTIPNWACRMWNLPKIYADITSRKDQKARTSVTFEKRTYEAWVTAAPHGRRKPFYRLWFDSALTFELKRKFVMSYMRSLEDALEDHVDVEKSIPFWEFLDVEFDPQKRAFQFTAYYTQFPSFPNLFQRLVGSPPIQKLGDQASGKTSERIYKQPWRPRTELRFEIGARNVIYMLLDSKAKLFYIGEAADLIKRLSQGYECIPNWNYFRYNILPDELAPYRRALERMLIRDFASVLENTREVEWRDVSGCRLANDRIDARR